MWGHSRAGAHGRSAAFLRISTRFTGTYAQLCPTVAAAFLVRVEQHLKSSLTARICIIIVFPYACTTCLFRSRTLPECVNGGITALFRMTVLVCVPRRRSVKKRLQISLRGVTYPISASISSCAHPMNSPSRSLQPDYE